MKFEDALLLYDILRQTLPGTELRGIRIKSVFIAPTHSAAFTKFLNYQIKEGSNAINHFLNDEISVYGASEQKKGEVPRVEIIILDKLRLEMAN